ncbi:MAG: hypothetical protein IJ583_04290 [Firmicutes bacterium]|nr:hypothetical protein [Bacillota bacterium]
MKTKMLSARISEELFAKLDKQAAENGINRNQHIVNLLSAEPCSSSNSIYQDIIRNNALLGNILREKQKYDDYDTTDKEILNQLKDINHNLFLILKGGDK